MCEKVRERNCTKREEKRLCVRDRQLGVIGVWVGERFERSECVISGKILISEIEVYICRTTLNCVSLFLLLCIFLLRVLFVPVSV